MSETTILSVGAVVFLAYEVVRWVTCGVEPSRATPPPVSCSSQLVSFLVPAWTAANDLEPFVRAFRSLSLPNKELILCVGGDDGSYERAQAWASGDIHVLLQLPGDGKQGALAKCWGLARGSIIYLTDIDCRPHDDVVNRLIAPIDAGESLVTTAGTCPVEDDLKVGFVRCRAAVDLIAGYSATAEGSGLNGRNAALHSSVLVAVGGFSVPAPSGTDYTLAQEVRGKGFRIKVIPSAPMPTRYPYGATQYIRQQRRWVRNVMKLSRRYHVVEDVRRTAMALLAAYMVVVVTLVAVAVPVITFFVGMLFVHVLVSRLGYQKRTGLRPNVGATVLFMGSDLIALLEAGMDVLTGAHEW